MTNHCGTCTACCRVYAIPELKKPQGKWCQHCSIGVGCKIYQQRPQACRDFDCIWLQSQNRENPQERMAPELRPDRSKVVLNMTTNPKIMGATTMPGAPDAWRRPAMHKFLAGIVELGLGVAIGQPNAKSHLVWTRNGQREVAMSTPDQDGMQWSEEKVS